MFNTKLLPLAISAFLYQHLVMVKHYQNSILIMAIIANHVTQSL